MKNILKTDELRRKANETYGMLLQGEKAQLNIPVPSAVAVLVMSGETTEEILNASDVKPDIVLQDAGEIMETV